MADKPYVWPFDVRETFTTEWPGNQAQQLARRHSAHTSVNHLAEGGRGPDLHSHAGPKLYYVLQGSMGALLGGATLSVPADTLVYVPAEVAHRHWNDGVGTEVHFEMIFSACTLDRAEGSSVVSGLDQRLGGVPFACSVLESALVETSPGIRVQTLSDASVKVDLPIAYYVELAVGVVESDVQVDGFDHYYLVLEGQLTVDVAQERYVVDAGSLAVLPAGAAHRQSNKGFVVEKHVAVAACVPPAGGAVNGAAELVDDGIRNGGTDVC